MIAACLGARPERAWLTALERQNATLSVSFVESRSVVVTRARSLRPRVILLPLRDATELSVAPLISRLRQQAPDVRVLVVTSPAASHAGVAEAIRAGAELATLDSEQDLYSVLCRTGTDSSLTVREDDAARAMLLAILPTELRETMLFCVHQAHRRLLPRQLPIAESTAHWPTPTELICWGRLLRASVVQWAGASNLRAIADASGFGSTRALQRAGARLLQRPIDDARDLAPLLVSSRVLRRVQHLASR